MSGNQKENPFLKNYLTELGLLRTKSPLSIDGWHRLNQLKAAGIPPDYATAEGLFDQFRTKGDIKGIEYLHQNGVTELLLTPVTRYLLQHYVEETQRQPKNNTSLLPFLQKKTESLGILKLIITKDLIRRLRPEGYKYLTVKGFCKDIIGQGEETRFDKSFQTIAYQVYGQKMTLPSPINGLRGMVTHQLLELDTEERMEEWLIDFCNLDEHDKQVIRESREKWHLKLSEQTGDTVITTDNIRFLEEKIGDYCDQMNISTAVEMLDQLPLSRQIFHIGKIAYTLFRLDRRPEALELLKWGREQLIQADMDAESKTNLFFDLISPHLEIVDLDGLSSILSGINEKGYKMLCQNLGLSMEQYNQLFAFCYYLEVSYHFNPSEIATETKRLFNNEYKKVPFVDNYGRIYGAEMYAGLLAARIYHFGEIGIQYPTPVEYQRTPYIARYLAIQYGLTNDQNNFTLWLKRLYKSPTSIGPEGEIRIVYEKIQETKVN